MRKLSDPVARFWSQVQKTDTCWLWQGGKLGRTYAKLWVTPERRMFVHRYSYELAYGPIPAGLHVCHRCDTPACVRPDHLFLGSDRDNAQDREQKGRGGTQNGCGKLAGERHAEHVLTTAQVEEMRERRQAGELLRVLAGDYGVSVQTVHRIVTRQAWTHLA